MPTHVRVEAFFFASDDDGGRRIQSAMREQLEI